MGGNVLGVPSGFIGPRVSGTDRVSCTAELNTPSRLFRETSTVNPSALGKLGKSLRASEVAQNDYAYGKRLRQAPTANAYGKRPWQMPMANACTTLALPAVEFL